MISFRGMPKKSILLRLDPVLAARLQQASRIYGSPSLSWFCREMIVSMMDKDRMDAFANRLLRNSRDLAKDELKKLKRRKKPYASS